MSIQFRRYFLQLFIYLKKKNGIDDKFRQKKNCNNDKKIFDKNQTTFN